MYMLRFRHVTLFFLTIITPQFLENIVMRLNEPHKEGSVNDAACY